MVATKMKRWTTHEVSQHTITTLDNGLLHLSIGLSKNISVAILTIFMTGQSVDRSQRQGRPLWSMKAFEPR